MKPSPTTDAGSDKSAVDSTTTDAKAVRTDIEQRIVDELTSTPGATLTVGQLQTRVNVPSWRLEDALDGLQGRDLARVKIGINAVTILLDSAEESHVRTDGGQPEDVDEGSDETTIADLTSDEVCEVLSSARRRLIIQILDALDDGDEPTYIKAGTIATLLTAIPTGLRLSELDSRERNVHYVALVQTHVDVLRDIGVIDYYEQVKKIQPHQVVTDLAEIIREIQRRCDESPDVEVAVRQWLNEKDS